MVTDDPSSKVSGSSVPGSIRLPPAALATCAEDIVKGLFPNAFENRTRILRPPIET
jgi:hypothetical protein